MTTEIKILLIEDNKGDYILAREMLAGFEQSPAYKEFSFQLTWAERLTSGLERLASERFDVILLDLSLPDAHGLDGLYTVRAVAADAPILVLTEDDDQTIALGAVNAGAQDYLVKGKLDRNLLFRAVRYSIDRTHAQRDLENARDTADRASRSTSDFLISMSDEVSTPLKSIIRLTKSVLDGVLTVDQRESLEQAKLSAQSLLKLHNNMVDFARIEGRALPLQSVEFKFHDYLNQVIAILDIQANEQGVELQCEIDDGIPKLLVADPERLGQVLQNLVENAIRFGKLEGVRGRIDVNCSIDSEADQNMTLHFAVTVSAINISLKEQQLVFESFAQADVSSLRKYGATGLGLAISSKLVELMGGRAWVKSDAGQGTSFHFTVSCQRTQDAAATAANGAATLQG